MTIDEAKRIVRAERDLCSELAAASAAKARLLRLTRLSDDVEADREDGNAHSVERLGQALDMVLREAES